MKRNSSLLTIFLTVLFSIFCISSWAQVSCTASAPSEVGVGQAFRYQVVLNEKPSKILSTGFSNFDVLNGPSQGYSSSTSIVNGKMTQSSSYSYTYTLAAKKEGQFTIPGMVFQVNGNQVKSNSVTIRVVEGGGSGGGASGGGGRGQGQQRSQQSQGFDKRDVYVKAFCSNTNPYVGEQVIITHKLYVAPSVNGGYQVTSVNAPTQSGLWSYTLGNPDAEAPRTTEVIDGKKFTVFEVRRTAVFPQKSGKITVTPFEIGFVARIIYTQQNSNDPFDMFFGGRQYAQDYNLDLKSNSVVLNCKPLPEANKPDDFSGLVGSFTLSSNLSRSELKTNDATNLTITVNGTGNLQHVEAPLMEFPADFDVTDPKISDNINTRGNSVSGSRSFEYIIIPREPGDFTVPAASFSYFDPKTHSYKTLTTDSYKMKVEKGKGGGVTTSSSNQKDIKFLSKDIRYIKTNGHAFHPKRSDFYGSSWFYVGMILPFLLLIIFIIVWRKRMETRQNVMLLKDKRANKVAKRRLKRAGQLLKAGQKEEFYVEISQVLWGYMSDKFHIPLSQLSMDTVEEKLREKQVNEDDIKEFLETLNQCEFARFAPGDSSQMMSDMYQRAHDFMTKIERR